MSKDPFRAIKRAKNRAETKATAEMWPDNLLDYDNGEGHLVTFTVPETLVNTYDGTVKHQETASYVIGGSGGVSLYIPEGIAAQYQVDWSGKDLESIVGSLVTGGVESAAETAIEAGKSRIAGGLSQSTGNDLKNYLAGSIQNSKARMLFQGVGFRSFSFSYSFVPKNADESLRAKKIINWFKSNMHPKGKYSEATLKYPPEFNIEYAYKSKGNVNPWLHKFKPCALTNLNVEYAVNGIWSTFSNGAPTEIKLTLQFTETEFLTQEDFEESNLEGLMY